MADAREEGAYSLHPETRHVSLGCGAVAVADIYQSLAVCLVTCHQSVTSFYFIITVSLGGWDS